MVDYFSSNYNQKNRPMTKQNKVPLYNPPPKEIININGKNIAVFNIGKENIDAKTVSAFSEEWEKFDSFTGDEIN